MASCWQCHWASLTMISVTKLLLTCKYFFSTSSGWLHTPQVSAACPATTKFYRRIHPHHYLVCIFLKPETASVWFWKCWCCLSCCCCRTGGCSIVCWMYSTVLCCGTLEVYRVVGLDPLGIHLVICGQQKYENIILSSETALKPGFRENMFLFIDEVFVLPQIAAEAANSADWCALTEAVVSWSRCEEPQWGAWRR